MTLQAKPRQAANWYAIRTATRQEHKVVEGLREMAQEHKLETDVYLPCETRWNRLGRVKKPKQVPLLAGYLFVMIDPQSLWRVEQVFGVYAVLRTSGGADRQAAIIPAEFLGDLRLAEYQGAFDLTKAKTGSAIEKGSTVRLTGGPFSGFVGEIVELRGKDRVSVMLSLFGHQAPIVVKKSQVETLDHEPAAAA